MGEVIKMEPKAALPGFIIEVHRYSEPEEVWVYTSLEPAAQGSYALVEYPLDGLVGDNYEEGPAYTVVTSNWFRQHEVAQERVKQGENGYISAYYLNEVPERLRGYVINCIAPLEWQKGLREQDPEVFHRITIRVKGEFPRDWY